MASKVRFDWDGDQLVRRLHTAAVRAVNETVDAAADEARGGHEWVNRTGQLEEEIVSHHADPAAANPTGSFGTTKERGFYGLFHEVGTTHEFERPFLRPAADMTFPTLAARIKRRFHS